MDEEDIKHRVIFGTGYGKPPEHGRFQKGQSGNPKGRPKKTTSDLALPDRPTLSAILAIADTMVPVREDGGLREISMREAVVRAAFASAAKGNARSQSTVIGLLQKSDEAKALEIRKSIEIWNEYKRITSAHIATAEKHASPLPKPLPHPDDIIIDYTNGPQFLGPIDEEEQRRLDETLRYRDVLILQDALDHRCSTRLNGQPLTEPGSAGLIAILLERAIPPRLRLSNTQWLLRTMKFETMPKRALLKNLFEASQTLGTPHPRGYVFPNLNSTQRRLGMIFEILRDIRTSGLDPTAMSNEDWEDAVGCIIARHASS
ncbi:hypothetical protein JJB09_25050 [Rhizobium sp. KVB221]|uniref:DUF5681 domain-containing protein n=1 Tax=Rhizobium setariae TaxID=2801340 RepID=A0A936YUH2_9HYPH|nr:DUF5681 domain-containing protein [Rhizobium setariae]MBL0375287.1 hypothetical protein [Rhizobium setariae]